MTIRAIYEKGVFRPIDPVPLPEQSEVEFELRVVPPGSPDLEDVYEILSRRYSSGQSDVAERHDEHQP